MSSTINATQVKRLWAIASGNGWSKQAVKDLLVAKKGIKPELASVRAITTDEYEGITSILNNSYSEVINSGLETFITMFDGQLDTELIEAIEPSIDSVVDDNWRDEDTGLNYQQYEAYCGILLWFQNSRSKEALLLGSAGTGKTFTIQLVIKAIQADRPSIHILVVTCWHRALKVIKAYANKSGLTGLNFSTVYSALSLRVAIDSESGKQTIDKSESEESIYEADLVVFDEVGVADKAIRAEIETVLMSRDFRGKIIYLGDNLQLPPIGEVETEFFSKVKNNRWELTQVMRFDGSIAAIVQDAKECVKTKARFNHSFWIPRSDSELNFVNKFQFNDLVFDYFDSPEYALNSDHCRILCFQNSTVKDWNQKIRRILVDSEEPYVVGELLVTNKPIRDTWLDTTLANNGSELLIHEVNSGLAEVDINGEAYRYDAILLGVENLEDGSKFTAFVIAESDSIQYSVDLDRLQKKAKQSKRGYDWRNFYKLMELNAPVQHIHAMTIHKSQGSGFNNVFVVSPDLNICSDSNQQPRLWYVALSRGRERIFIVK